MDSPTPIEENGGKEIAMCMSQLYRDESVFIPNPNNAEEMCKAFGSSDRDIENERFPMRPKLVQHEQTKDKVIQELLYKEQSELSHKDVEGYELVH